MSRLLGFLVVNHPLVDDNKRLGWLAVVVFYGLDDIDLGLFTAFTSSG